jgi:uncharacterized DUF497 family protein
VQVIFDPEKNRLNLAKHGVALSDAAKLNWDLLLCAPDVRRDYGELREIGFAPIAQRVFNVVFVQRGDVFRIISLRKANSKEVHAYDQALRTHGVHPPHP